MPGFYSLSLLYTGNPGSIPIVFNYHMRRERNALLAVLSQAAISAAGTILGAPLPPSSTAPSQTAAAGAAVCVWGSGLGRRGMQHTDIFS